MGMDAERWAAVERLYHAARERRDAGGRAAFLDQACAHDAALRAEVESLLAHDPAETSAFMEVPAVAQLAGDMAAATARFEGVRFGPYKLGTLLAAGGMGEVYRAEDTRLGREVAVKVLPAYVSTDPARRARLEREARAIAAVTHPNICALYDVGREGDVEFLVLEYVQGETLAGRLTRGAMPLDEALRIAGGIAAALAAAHARGIVHRDLKPANVVLTRAGAKLLDFGLAKLAGPAAASLASRPTNAASLTEIGSILGTLQYMSPEQVEGQEADARSDIFAFGAMLHEMVSGVKAFEGKSQASLIAAILEREPTPLPQLRPDTPPALARVVRTCLAKDPAARWQSAADLQRELTWLLEDLPSHRAGTLAGPPPRAAWLLRAGWGAAAVATIAAVALAAWPRPVPGSPNGPPMRLSLGIPDALAGKARFPTISPDGRHVVFSDGMGGNADAARLWVRDTERADARILDGTEGALLPFWSPDSAAIAFFAKGALKRLDLATGSVQTLCDAPAGRGGAWSPDGTIIFSPDQNAPIMRVAAQGGSPATRLDAAQDSHRVPSFLPDGRHFVFTKLRNSGVNAIAIGSTDSLTTRDVVSARALVTQGVVVSGKLLYVREGTLVAQEFDDRTLAPRGEQLPLVPHVFDDGLSHMAFSVSAAGVVLFKAAARQMSQLTLMARSGARIRDFGTQELSPRSMALSGDSRKLAVERIDPATELGAIWVIDVQGGQAEPLTSGADSGGAVWSPDGRRILYQRAKAWALYELYISDVDGGRQQLVVPAGPSTTPKAWLPDGTILYTAQASSGGSVDLWRLPAGGKAPGEKVPTAPNPISLRASQDGHWLAYVSTISGRAEVFVQGYPEGPRRQITSSGGSDPQWHRDGKELYYLAEDGTKVMAVELGLNPTPEAGVARPLFDVSKGSTYVPAPDGQTFYVALRQPPASPPALTLLLNWSGLAPKR
jgi:eukaryotic-like serine/threonine-protein kinase